VWDGKGCVAVAEPAFPKTSTHSTNPLIGRWRGLGPTRARYVFYADGTCWWALPGARGDEWLGEGEWCVSSGCRYLVSGNELSIFRQSEHTRCTDTKVPDFPAETQQRFRLEGSHLILTQAAGEGAPGRSVFVRATGALLAAP
jgi:hypothetical protein